MGHNHEDGDQEHYYDDSYLHKNQHVFLEHYINMLETCEKGMGYISTKGMEEDLNKQMLEDCTAALKAINDANFLSWNLMKTIDREAYDKIRSYDDIIPSLEKVEVNQAEGEINGAVDEIIKEILPFFMDWSKEVIRLVKAHI